MRTRLRIVLCGSMSFKDQMQDAKILLTKLGHDVLLTPGDEDLEGAPLPPISEKASRKVALDVFALYHGYIQKADAVLCYNETKGSVPHYIGANSFLELGFAAALHKKMYLLYPIPDMPYLREELVAMNPYILYGRLENIGADI